MDGLCGETAQYTTSAIIHRKNRANNLHLRDDETLLYFLASILTQTVSCHFGLSLQTIRWWFSFGKWLVVQEF